MRSIFISRIKSLCDVDGAKGRVRVGKRVPLAEVLLNRLHSSGNGGEASSDVICCSSSARTVVVPAVSAVKENLCQSNFETPRKESGGFESESRDYFSASGLLDDDFDDSILEQIDIMCEEKSAVKTAGVEGLGHSCHEKVSSEGNVVRNVDMGSGTNISKDIGNDDLNESILEQIDILFEQKSAEKEAGMGVEHNCRERVSSESGVVSNVDMDLGTSAFPKDIGNGEIDDFDESILEQIDILCEQKSAVKAAGQGLDQSCQENVSSESGLVCTVDMSLATSAVSEGIGSGDMLCFGIDLDHKEEHVDSETTRKSLPSGTMPEEYSKYLKSLNERQREAACIDVSTPLMIVAGPGSGKVFLNSAFFNILFFL